MFAALKLEIPNEIAIFSLTNTSYHRYRVSVSSTISMFNVAVQREPLRDCVIAKRIHPLRSPSISSSTYDYWDQFEQRKCTNYGASSRDENLHMSKHHVGKFTRCSMEISHTILKRHLNFQQATFISPRTTRILGFMMLPN